MCVVVQVHVEVVQKQNGSVTKEQPSAAEPSTSYKHNTTAARSSLTLPPDPISPVSTTEERKERARTLSARSFDPLPEIPKLELAEDEAGSSETKHTLNDEEEAAYSYARVPGRNSKDVPESDSSDDEGVDSPEGDKNPSSGLPPYGKVTRNQTLDKVQPGDDYAEVIGENVVPPPLGARDRSVTAPVDPTDFGMIRDTRAYTESATHLPLPAIPGGSRLPPDEDNQMYDSIPEHMEGKKAKPANVQLNERKERLYESVDEMGQEPEDMYESVPEDLKVDSPLHVSPIVSTPTPSSPEGISFPSLSVVPCPPDSPIPSHRDKSIGSNVKVEKSHGKSKKAEKKALEKTLSASDQAEKKRTFSMFSRKKATSVSAGVGKTKKKLEKDVQVAKPHHRDPLPDIPHQVSPSHTVPTPRPPSIPAPAPPKAMNDEDEDLYDKPQLPVGKERISSDSDVVTEKGMTTEEAKTRAKSLPSGMRSAGASIFKFRQDLPLPDVPEDSGQGMVTVTHKRVLEDDSEAHKPYDLVVLTTPPPDNQDEPNYDTVRPEDILDPNTEVRNEADPGYDKVGKHLLEDGEEGERSAGVEDHEETLEKEQDDNPTGQEGATVLGYGKVTRISSPEGENVSSGPRPEHDEVGYAVIPEMIKMRKRALSASQVKQQKLTSQDTEAIPAVVSNSFEGTLRDLSPTSPSSTQDEQYALVDMAAKRKQRARENKEQQGTLSPTGRESGGASPAPPPLPPVGDLGDMSEFAEPPLPQRSEDADHLIIKTEHESGYSRVLKVPRDGNLEPPYAKVKSKNDHPYAELDIGGGIDGQPEVIITDNKHEEVRYETPDALISPSSLVNEMSSGYDTVGDMDTTVSKVPAPNTGASETIETMDFDESHVYDTLDPVRSSGIVQVAVSSPESEDGVASNMYDVLEAQSQQNGRNEDKEEPYEEIDEETRLNLQKMHQR